jgi:hypothetical protein
VEVAEDLKLSQLTLHHHGVSFASERQKVNWREEWRRLIRSNTRSHTDAQMGFGNL